MHQTVHHFSSWQRSVLLLIVCLCSVEPIHAVPVTYSTQGNRGLATLAFAVRHVFIDLDNDGDLDILYQTGNTTGTGIAVQLNTGGAYGTAIPATTGTGLFSNGPLSGIAFSQVTAPNIAAADLDNDGDMDLIEFLNNTTPRWLQNNGNGTFTASNITTLPALPFGARQLLADVNNDSAPDVLYQTSSTNGTGVALQLNNGNGTFAGAINATSGTGLFTSGPLNNVAFLQITAPNNRAVDIDDDGDEDILEFINATAPRLIRNNGDGTFTAVPFSAVPTLPFGSRQLFFDMDSDGDQDVLYQTSSTAGTGISVQLNNGNGTFAPAINATAGTGTFTSGPLNGISLTQVSPLSTGIADYDHDKDADIIDFVNNVSPNIIRQDGTRPQLFATSPADNATGVSVSTDIVLTFDRSVVKGNGNLYLTNAATHAVLETVAISNAAITGSGATWTYHPAVQLAGSTRYALRADEEIFIDADSRAFYGIFEDTTLNFTTAAAASITTGALSATAYCTGARLAVAFSTANLTPAAGNAYTVQLSNAGGTFTSPVPVGSLSSTATSGSINVTIPTGTGTGSGYRVRVVSSAPATTGSDNGTNLTITAPSADPSSIYLANATTSQSATINAGAGYTYTDGSCRAIASITSTGAGMGSTTAKVSVQSTAPSYNTAPYVRRYYDITPSANAATATATVTLYYTQADFTNYNANNGTAPDLPASPSDAAGIANLRITQQHGSSATGAPGTFTGWSGSGPANVLIDPLDPNIVWNSGLSRWEVTFNVTGFSGFFAFGNSDGSPLPVQLETFTAKAEAARNRIDWATAIEDAGTMFHMERSTDGSSFSRIGSVPGKGSNSSYFFYDGERLPPIAWYRLHMLEASGRIHYSNTLPVTRELPGGVMVFPTAASSVVHIVNSNAALNGTAAVVMDPVGKVICRIKLQPQQDLEVREWPAGLYALCLSDGSVVRLLKVQ